MESEKRGVLIAQITDTHVGFEPEAGENEFNFVRFRNVLGHLLNQKILPDMLILSGDLTDGGQPDSYARIRELVAECPFPVHVIPGNHDSRDELLKAFPDCPTADGFAQFAIDCDDGAGNALRVLCLDSFEPGRHGGAFCEVRAAWLAKELAAHPDTPTVIFMHHPPVVAGIDWMDPKPGEAWFKRFHDTVKGHDQIISIQAGHLHRPLHSVVEGIPLSVTPAVAPAVALDLRPMDAEVADSRPIVAAEPPFYSLHLWRGGEFVSHFQPVGHWQTLARFEEHLKPMMKGLFAERV
ncbi:putative cAMP phosphodiesterase [Erythrobacter sp. NAP1]|uniref:phosphodiesterase n=1 Tax=Erythrobacter sp. NAP1 TaxID=237727 RepID=UPI000068510F|nr:phosphodiesterase [Erythrobacter sp. NAP1]EAQ27834.1 putative cAMP phosphodiesterase [Erythrobacter sp. NAP1]